MIINGKTTITGIIGWPVEHSLSPAMHNAAFSALSLNCCYVPFPVSPEYLGDAVRSIRALNIRGINVTVPHKETVLAYLDEIDPEASFIGAVNTIVNRDGRLIGYNTDGRGFMQSLEETHIDPKDMEILIVGAGGGARSVGYSLAEKARSISIYGRTVDRVERFARDLRIIGKPVTVLHDLSQLENFDLIVHATPLGLKENDPLPIDTAQLRSGQVVCDLIYVRTKLLDEASEKGCISLSGAGMLLWQGVLAFELWTHLKPDVDVMRRAMRDAGAG